MFTALQQTIGQIYVYCIIFELENSANFSCYGIKQFCAYVAKDIYLSETLFF